MHTPGPWSVFASDWSEGTYIINSVNEHDCETCDTCDDAIEEHCRYCPYGEADEANARLIAAAPALLEALERAVQDIDGGWNADEADAHFPWLFEARSAIARATGEGARDA